MARFLNEIGGRTRTGSCKAPHTYRKRSRLKATPLSKTLTQQCNSQTWTLESRRLCCILPLFQRAVPTHKNIFVDSVQKLQKRESS